ncbi:MAG: UDP-N-acetylmuramate:L-alanyl-gamma-D-glutamyl-meso-diaminopimelate ligase, partial [Deltaproteobacteria bacterium]|nr:UDP-N-acetylmuramate:L-alanyl-gamma-D-glutamyl-meso-diaminopimelate ligase [Deltaproteobacteria bacterium]
MSDSAFRKIHLIGICGSAMGALAAMLKQEGHQVTGSDQGAYPPISDFLAEREIPVLSGYKAEHIDEVRPDLVIVGNVVRRENPEAQRAMDLGLAYKSLPQTLADLFLTGRQPVVVAGTHGKTTTTNLVAWLLSTAGADPSFLAGGISRNLGANYKLGKGPYFAVEGDEYDTAFFDKTPKFVHYRPFWAVLTGVEYDHADIYPDLKSLESAFGQFVDLIPAQGRLMVYAENETAVRLASRAACQVLGYGFGPQAQTRAEEISLGPGRVSFRLKHRGRDQGLFESPLPGRHNLANTLAALGL